MTAENNTNGARPGEYRLLDSSVLVLKPEILTYRRELPRLIAEGNEGRFVLIKGNQVLGIWDSDEDAYHAGLERFGLGAVFLAQPIDARDLKRVFPQELEPDAGK